MSENQITTIQDKTFKVIQSAMNKMVDMIRPTYGPASNKVIISKVLYKGIPDDGVQIAREFELPDPAENAVVGIIREMAIRTNDRVGDGTTGSLIMGQAIINEVARKRKFDGRRIEIELQKGLEDVRKQLRKSAKPIKTKEDLKKVALISFDDENIAEMIASLYHKLGKDGIITIDKSSTMDTAMEMTDGVKLEHGYLSPYMIINPERMESVVEKPYILLTDYRITEVTDILPIMEKMVAENKRELVIICENMEQSALATVVLNKLQGKFLTIVVTAPSGDDRKLIMEDLAILTGGKMFTESKGDKLETATLADLGRATRFICRRDESIIVGPKGKRQEINKAIMGLKAAMSTEAVQHIKDSFSRRLALMTNTLAVIKVGAPTENAQKTLRYKVEDAINAVKEAFRGGVVCGAGMALARIKTSSPLLNEALQYPSRQLRENMGIDEIEDLGVDEVLNVVTGKKGKFMDVGVMDPAEVLLAGVESAVSIASILVTSSGMIVEAPKKPPVVEQ